MRSLSAWAISGPEGVHTLTLHRSEPTVEISAMPLDPVQLALTQNRLDYITRQMGDVMVRTARSPIFSQAHDFTCFVCGPDGWLVSQADGIPIHSGGGGFAVRAVLRDFEGDIEPGDAFVLNDPWQAGGNHLPDWVVARPVFVGDRPVAFACNRAHQSDIGAAPPEPTTRSPPTPGRKASGSPR